MIFTMLKSFIICVLVVAVVGALNMTKEQFIPTQFIFPPTVDVYAEVHQALRKLHAPKEKVVELGNAIKLASVRTGLDEKLLAALMYTESKFDKKAVSSKQYKGLMQTPFATNFSDVDVLHGAFILKDKLRQTNGDLPRALALYKGGDSPEAHREADHVIRIWGRL